MRKFVRRNKLILFFLTALGVYFFVNLHSTNVKLNELGATREVLLGDIKALEAQVERLNDEYEYVQTEEAVEREAREKLKMVKSNEIIYLIRGSENTEEGEADEKSDN